MKRKISNRSAFFHIRLTTALALCLAGLSLGVIGALTGRAVQAQGARDSEEYDPDLPAFMVGKIDKDEYLQRRTEHINKLRGIAPGRPLDPGARGRAIQQMNRQAGISSVSTSTAVNGSSFSQASADAFSANSLSLNASTWTSIGPSPLPNGQTFNTNNVPVSGRTVAIAIHPTNSNIAYVGAAQGGVYRTTDGGATWTALFDNAQTLSIGAIAIAPSQPSTIYVGTGEGNFSGDCFFGVGIYRIDNADTASPILVGPLNKNLSNVDVLSGWGIDRIIVHPTDPNTIFFGTTSGIGGVAGVSIGDTTATSTKPRGLFRSTNAAGLSPTFQKLTAATDNGGNLSVTDVEFEPGNPNNLLVGIRGTSVAGSGGVYRSTNALAANPTFTRTLAVGSATVLTRTEIGIAKVGGQATVFAATTDASGTLKRSTDGGVTWSAALAGATGFCGGQCDYDMPVAVDPTNANVIYLGGPGDGAPAHIMIKSSNALAATPTFATVQTGLHADEHAIEIDPSNTSIVWTGNDGGIWRSTNGGTNWTSLNNPGYVATQFESLALHPIDANFTIGGTQDNGTECQGPCGTFVGNVWNQADFGDGGFALIDQSATNLTSVNMYHTYFNQTNNLIGYAFVTSAANAKFTSSPTADNWTFNGAQCPTAGGGYACAEAVEFYMPMALGPGTPNPVYTGTDRLHRAAIPGATNTTVSQTFVTGVPISAVGISRQNDSIRMVGLANGKVFRTLTAQTTGWPDVTGAIPAGYVSRAVVDPNNQNTAYVTLSAYFGTAASHIWKTTNFNVATPTWVGIDGGQIPDIPINAFVIDPSNSSNLYAGTDIGVYRSTDGGATWQPYSNGLPRVAVFDMAIQNPNHILRIATHGRGMWEIFIGATSSINGTVTDAGTNSPIGGATVTTGGNTTTTDASGSYQLLNVPVGTFNMTASADGYASSTVSGVVVTAGQPTTQNFALTTAAVTGCLTDTTQADFDAGLKSSVETSASGDVKLTAAAPISDAQSTTLTNFVDSITSTAWLAQTFTPTVTGKLSQVQLQSALAAAGTTGTMVVEIRNTAGGLPGPTVLGSTTITTITGTGNAWYAANYATPADVNAGTVYAIVLRATSGGPYRAVRGGTNSYAGGAWFSSTNSGGSWGAAQTTDLAFQTFISTGFLASGTLASETFDSNPVAGGFQRWTTLSFTASTPANTTLKFQVAASNNAAGPFTFVGPDGTAATFFTTSGVSLTQFNGSRYLKYKAFLATTNSGVTPTLNDVTVCFNNTPKQNQTINFPPIADKTYGDADSDPGATASSGLTVTYNAVGNCSIVAGKIHITSIGSCTVTASQAGSDVYNAASSVSQPFGINKRNATWTTNPNSKTYGSNDPNPLTTGSGSGFVASDNVVATYSRAAGETVAGGPYHITATLSPAAVLGNYNITNNGADFTISRKDATWTTNNNSKTYNDADPNPITTGSGSGFLVADGVTANYSRDPGETVAGSPYHITAALSPSGVLDNYNITNNGGSFTIAKAASTTTVTVSNATYDGFPHGGTAIAEGVNGLSQVVDVNYTGRNGTTYGPSTTAPTNAGDYAASATFAGDDNHSGSSDSKNYTIAKADASIAVTPYTVTYNGNPHMATGSATGVEMPTPVDLTSLLHLGGTTHTSAGTYTDTWTFDGNGNYKSATSTVTDEIDKATASIVVTEYGVTYDAMPHTATGTAKGVNDEDLTGLVLTGTTHTNAGDFTADGWTFSNANYNDQAGSVHDQIAKAPSTTTVTVASSIFDGLPHGGMAGVTGVGNLNQGLTVFYSGRNGTSYPSSTIAPSGAGDYTASASYPGDGNHEGSADAKDYSIGKSSPVISWNNPAAIVYGTPLSATQLNAVAKVGSLVIPGSYLYTPPAGNVLNAGNGQTLGVTFTPDDAGNYTSATKSVLINVNQKPATVTADNKTKQFSDPLPSFTATVTGLVGTDTLGGLITFSTSATALSPAGTYSIAPGGTGFNPNYTVSFANGTLTVMQEDATLTYTGDTLLTAGNNNTATVVLAAAVQEAQDGYLGNALGGKMVKFSIYKSSNITLTTADYTATATINGVNNIATTTISLPDDDYSIKLELLPNLYYSAPVEAAAVTVVIPGSGQASGGGWLTDPNGGRGHFAFTVKYVPSGKPKGHSLYIYRDRLDLSAYGAPSGLRDYDVVVKSTALSALNLNNTTSPGTATFTGKDIIVATDRITGMSYTISGGLGLQFEVDVTDNGEPGSSDTYALRIWSTSGTYRAVGTYTPSGVNTSGITLGGGNIQVK